MKYAEPLSRFLFFIFRAWRATFLLGWWAGEETRNLVPQPYAQEKERSGAMSY